MVFGDEVEDDDGSLGWFMTSFLTECSTSIHVTACSAAWFKSSKEGTDPDEDQVDDDCFLQVSGHLTRRLAAKAGPEPESMPATLGVNLSEDALVELAAERGAPMEKMRALAEEQTIPKTSTSTSASSTARSSEPSSVVLNRAARSVQLNPAPSTLATSLLVQLQPASSSTVASTEVQLSPASSTLTAQSQQRMVTIKEVELKGGGDQERHGGSDTVEKAEKEGKYRRIRVKKEASGVVPSVKGDSKASSGSKVILTREQRLERLRRFQRDRQVRLEKLMEKKEEDESKEEDEKKEKKPRKRRTLQPNRKRKAHHLKREPTRSPTPRTPSPSTTNAPSIQKEMARQQEEARLCGRRVLSYDL